MELYKKFYKGVFEGKSKKNLRINRYTVEDVLKEIFSYIPENEEGLLEIQEIDFKTKERRIIKRIIIVNELFLTKKGAGYVMADKMRFEINSSTGINDWRGNDITLEELQVPSKAVVEYYKKAGHANTSIAVSIREVLIPE